MNIIGLGKNSLFAIKKQIVVWCDASHSKFDKYNILLTSSNRVLSKPNQTYQITRHKFYLIKISNITN